MTPAHPRRREDDHSLGLRHLLALCASIVAIATAYTFLIRPAIAETNQDARITAVERCAAENTKLAKESILVAAAANAKTVNSLEQINIAVAQIKIEQAAARATQEQVLIVLRDLKADRDADRKELIELIKRQP